MSPDALNSLFSLCIGFALAGALASGYQAMAQRPAGFGLLQEGVAPKTFAAVPFLVFAAPFIIMRNTLRGAQIERRRFEFVMMATVLAGFWSLMSGTFFLMTLRAAGVAGLRQLLQALLRLITRQRLCQGLRERRPHCMAIYELDGQGPELPADGNYFIADTATVIGKVRLLNSASVWFGAVLRGDNEWIEIGEGSNVQDNSTCHTDLGFPLTIGKNCTVGHNVILHGCTLEDGALVGMGSIVMNGARIGRGSIVGAGSVITEGKEFPEHSLIIGSPARVIRTLVARAGGGDGKCREILRRQRAAFQKRPEEDRLSGLTRRRIDVGLRSASFALVRFDRAGDLLVAGGPERMLLAAVLIRIGFRRNALRARRAGPARTDPDLRHDVVFPGFRSCLFRRRGLRHAIALLRSASFRSTGMPCFFSRSAKASSASS